MSLHYKNTDNGEIWLCCMSEIWLCCMSSSETLWTLNMLSTVKLKQNSHFYMFLSLPSKFEPSVEVDDADSTSIDTMPRMVRRTHSRAVSRNASRNTITPREGNSPPQSRHSLLQSRGTYRTPSRASMLSVSIECQPFKSHIAKGLWIHAMSMGCESCCIVRVLYLSVSIRHTCSTGLTFRITCIFSVTHPSHFTPWMVIQAKYADLFLCSGGDEWIDSFHLPT